MLRSNEMGQGEAASYLKNESDRGFGHSALTNEP
jgi:hypothetical protein